MLLRREFKENGLIRIESVHLLNTIVNLTKIEFMKRSNKNIFKEKKFAIISSQWESQLRPYQHNLMVR